MISSSMSFDETLEPVGITDFSNSMHKKIPATAFSNLSFPSGISLKFAAMVSILDMPFSNMHNYLIDHRNKFFPSTSEIGNLHG